MPKMIYICILLIYFKVISKKGGHYCPRLPYTLGKVVIQTVCSADSGLFRGLPQLLNLTHTDTSNSDIVSD